MLQKHAYCFEKQTKERENTPFNVFLYIFECLNYMYNVISSLPLDRFNTFIQLDSICFFCVVLLSIFSVAIVVGRITFDYNI